MITLIVVIPICLGLYIEWKSRKRKNDFISDIKAGDILYNVDKFGNTKPVFIFRRDGDIVYCGLSKDSTVFALEEAKWIAERYPKKLGEFDPSGAEVNKK